jgi:uncharacterized protein YwqG
MGIFDFLFKKKKDIPETKNEQVLPVRSAKNKAIDHTLLEKVEVAPGLSIPRAFANHWNELQAGPCPAVSIIATPAEDLRLEQSKFGHYPYMPLTFDYPRDETGEYMYPLVQLNFSEMPALPGYPRSGYLQCYISVTDGMFGLDYDALQDQKNFRVLFFEEDGIKEYKTDFSFLDKVMQAEHVPVYKPHALAFKAMDEYVGPWDARYRRLGLADIHAVAARYPAEKEKLMSEAYVVFSNSGHKVGGYAAFTQDDPRMGEGVLEEYLQLLQIDSGEEIMWGDMGIAHFFIHPDDLAKKDFSKVMYTWDCS